MKILSSPGTLEDVTLGDETLGDETETKSEKEDIEEKEDIFADAVNEVSQNDSQEVSQIDSPEKAKSDTVKPNNDTSATGSVKRGVTDTNVATSVAKPQSLSLSSTFNQNSPEVDYMSRLRPEDEEEEEEVSQFNIEITVTEPRKMGDGMNAYMAYRVNTKTTIPQFSRAEMSVYRRFSDFLGLHEKLVEKHQARGMIVPPAPEKSVVGMTKIKMMKEEAGSADFVEKRRAALERYLNRTAKQPQLSTDPTFIEFLQLDDELPKSTSTSALSGAGMLRLFGKVGDSISKMTFKMDETDQWFEEKQQQIDALDQQLRKLHASIEALVIHRKDLAMNTGSFAKSAAMVGNAEEHTALSRALSQLAEIEERIDQLHMDQADADFFVLSELIKDYVGMVAAVKGVFHERVKCFRMWKEAEMNLTKKREVRAKLELARKMDKIPAVNQEITQLEMKVEQGERDFESISKTIRKEVVRFEKQRVRDFKSTIVNYLESLMNNQQQLIKYWESFLPEAKAIA
ncbi:Sorting nexin-2 [Lamellibrachia satsuma]|nr:Sorting nexin-2 [Lamellibrachia satsuma]